MAGSEVDGFAAVAREGGATTSSPASGHVADTGTQALMRAFYRRAARRRPPAEALRQAQLALLHGKRASAIPSTGQPSSFSATKNREKFGKSARKQEIIRLVL